MRYKQKQFSVCLPYFLYQLNLIDGASLVALMVNNLLAMQETQVRSHPLEGEIATHSSILAWEIPLSEEPGRLQSMRLQRVRHDRMMNTFKYFVLSIYSLPEGLEWGRLVLVTD